MQIELQEVKGETKLILADDGFRNIIPLGDPEAALPIPLCLPTSSQMFLTCRQLDAVIYFAKLTLLNIR